MGSFTPEEETFVPGPLDCEDCGENKVNCRKCKKTKEENTDTETPPTE
jgi:NifB/MoaA-like Fe-S oxidoreductase